MKHFRYFSIVSLFFLITRINCTFSEQGTGQDDYEYDSTDYDYNQDSSNAQRDARKGREKSLNFNAFSDAELSAALSRLSTFELNQLSQLMAKEDAFAADHQQTKRECQQEPCSDSAEVSELAADERNQVASFRGWFRKQKPSTTPTTRPTRAKVTKRKPIHAKKVNKPRKKHLPRKLSHQIIDDVKLYGNDRSAKAVLDRNVHNKIDLLKSKLRNIKSHKQQHRRNPLKKNVPLVSETAGFLEDSFPDPAQQTDLFRQPLESLIRVKRNNAQV